MEACRDHRDAESAGRSAASGRGKDRYGEYTVGREQETGYDRCAVEDVAGQVVEGSEPGEVQLPPQRVPSRQNRYDHAGGKSRHRPVTEVVSMVTGPMSRHGRAGDRGDARAFGRGEEGQRTHVLQVRRAPKPPTPHVDNFGNRRFFADAIPRSAVLPLRA
jgi:hypothetical protein